MGQPIHTDRTIIVGAGMGALYAALKLAPLPVLVISPEPLGEGASSAWAQGGIAAAMGTDDSPEQHAADTIATGVGIVNEDVTHLVTRAAHDFIHDLYKMGTPFDRTHDGGFVLAREAAHSLARVVRVQGDQAGFEIMKALIAKVRSTASIQVLDGVLASGLDTLDGAVCGVWITTADANGSRPILVRGAAYLLAGGGSGGLFALTTNPPRIRGQVIGFAARAGAQIADAEFVQFHPTAIYGTEDPAPLATEALRGKGAVLINNDGHRFMVDIHPDGELAPRDIVARAVFAQTQAGKGPMLDTRDVLGAGILDEYPAVAKACERAGIDPVEDAIPIAAAAHYHMGGIETDIAGRASLGNLWVCGEASSTGLHGANRLASNGLLEAIAFAQICADGIAATLGKSPTDNVPFEINFEPASNQMDQKLVQGLRNTMTKNVGVVRNARSLKQALIDIAHLETAANGHTDFLNMTATATLIAAAALVRQESRGSHYRDDFPQANPDFAHRSFMTLEQALHVRREVVQENLK
ncbi:MAG: L-aspartate oxidase [Paracoccaceae bacterium]